MEIYEKHPNIDLRHVHFVFVQEFTMHKRCRMCDTFVHIECVIHLCILNVWYLIMIHFPVRLHL